MVEQEGLEVQELEELEELRELLRLKRSGNFLASRRIFHMRGLSSILAREEGLDQLEVEVEAEEDLVEVEEEVALEGMGFF